MVRGGDSLTRIAARLDVRLADLLRVNSLTLSSLIFPGQQLRSATAAAGSSAGAGGTTYTVQPGDWLSRIASRHGVTLSALLAANDLTVNSLIVPGQRLVIPRPAGASGRRIVRRIRHDDVHGAARRLVEPDRIPPGCRAHGAAGCQRPDGQQSHRARSAVADPAVATGGGGGSGAGGTPNRPDHPAGCGAHTTRSGLVTRSVRSCTQHDISLDALLAVNGFTRSSLITPSMPIRLPAGAALTRVDRVLNYALGTSRQAVQFFTRGPDFFDCSGFTVAAYAQIGVSLIHHSVAQATQGTEVDFLNEAIRAGDLVFQDTNGDGVINHVGIALGDTTWVQRGGARGVP